MPEGGSVREEVLEPWLSISRTGYETKESPAPLGRRLTVLNPSLSDSQRAVFAAKEKALVTFRWYLIATAGFLTGSVFFFAVSPFPVSDAVVVVLLAITSLILAAGAVREIPLIRAGRRQSEKFGELHPTEPIVRYLTLEGSDRRVLTLCHCLAELFVEEDSAKSFNLRTDTYIVARRYDKRGAEAFDELFDSYETHTGKSVFTD